MWYLLIGIIAAVGIIISCSSKSKKTVSESGGTNTIDTVANALKDSIIPEFSREDIMRKLLQLSMTPAPENLSRGAMCYDMAMPPETAAYVCPKCGEKTLYERDKYENGYEMIEKVMHDIEACRQLVKKIDGISVQFDESQFCKKCSPNATKPQLCLTTKLKGEENSTRVCYISHEDIGILIEFLKGEKIHKAERESEEPLKNYIGRIEEMLGVSLKE